MAQYSRGWHQEERNNGGYAPPSLGRGGPPPPGWRPPPPPESHRRFPRDWPMPPPPPHPPRRFDDLYDGYSPSPGRHRPPVPPPMMPGPWADRYRFMPPPPPPPPPPRDWSRGGYPPFPPPPPPPPMMGGMYPPAPSYHAERVDSHGHYDGDAAKVETPYLQQTFLDAEPMIGEAMVPNGNSVGVHQRKHTVDTMSEFTGEDALDGDEEENSVRVLCIADIRGKLSYINELADKVGATAVIHTGDFGFFDQESVPKLTEKTLSQIIQHTPLLSEGERADLLAHGSALRDRLDPAMLIKHLSELPEFITGEKRFNCPVYVTHGAVEDVAVLESFRLGRYHVPMLHLVDEATTWCLPVGGLRLRLLGLGGALVRHKFFDNGDGEMSIAGAGGNMWSTLLQLGELAETARRVYDPCEVRILMTQASPGKDALVAQIALATHADYSLSGGMSMPYPIIWNAFAVHGNLSAWRERLALNRDSMMKLWQKVRHDVEGSIDEVQYVQLQSALSIANVLPPVNADEKVLRDLWCINLPEADMGRLVLVIRDGRVSVRAVAQGMDFARREKGIVVEGGRRVSDIPVTFRPPPSSLNNRQQKMTNGHTQPTNTSATAVHHQRVNSVANETVQPPQQAASKMATHERSGSFGQPIGKPLSNVSQSTEWVHKKANPSVSKVNGVSAVAMAAKDQHDMRFHQRQESVQSISSITQRDIGNRGYHVGHVIKEDSRISMAPIVNNNFTVMAETDKEEHDSHAVTVSSPPTRPGEPGPSIIIHARKESEDIIADSTAALQSITAQNVAERILTAHSAPVRQRTPVPYPLRQAPSTSVASPVPVSALMDDGGRQTPIQTINNMIRQQQQQMLASASSLHPEDTRPAPPARRGTPLDILKRRHTPVPKDPPTLKTWALDAPEFVPKSVGLTPPVASTLDDVSGISDFEVDEVNDSMPMAPSSTLASQMEHEEPLSIWVGGFFDVPIEEDEIRHFFSVEGGGFGGVTNVKLVYDQSTGKQKPFCFVDFESVEYVQKAFKRSGAMLKGRPIRIRLANVKNSQGVELESRPVSAAPVPALSVEAPPFVPTFSISETTAEHAEVVMEENNVQYDIGAQVEDVSTFGMAAQAQNMMPEYPDVAVEETQYRIWFGGLYNDNVTEADVYAFFGPLATSITAVKILYNHHTGLQRPYCFVDFEDEISLEKALGYGGRPLRSNLVKISRAGEHIKNPPLSATFGPGYVLPSAGLAPPGFWTAASTNWAADEPSESPIGWTPEMTWPAPPQIIEIQKPTQVTPNPNTVWVGGFYNDSVTEEEIREFFGDLNERITKVKLMYDKATGKQRAFCFVEFDDPSLVEEALGYTGKVLRNHIIKINRAGQRERGASISVINQYPVTSAYDYGMANLGSIAEEAVTPLMDAGAYSALGSYQSNAISENIWAAATDGMPHMYANAENAVESNNLSESMREEYNAHVEQAATEQAQTAESTYTLWIGGFFNETVNEDELRQFLGPSSDKIVNIKFMFDRKTNRQRPFCFVDFRSEQDLEEAMLLNGKMLKSISVKMNRAGQKEDIREPPLVNPKKLTVDTKKSSNMNINAPEWTGAMTSAPQWPPELDPQQAQSTIWAAAAITGGTPQPGSFQWADMDGAIDGNLQPALQSAWHEQDYQGYDDFQFVDEANHGTVWAPPKSALEFPHAVSWEESLMNGQSDLGRTLWVGGITVNPIEEDDFKEWFKGVEQVHFILDRTTGQRRPFCYIDFDSPQHAADAMLFSGQLFNGNKLVMKPTDTFDQDKRKTRGRRGTRRGRGMTGLEEQPEPTS